MFSIQTSNQTVQVAQDMAVRRNMAGNLALRTVGPIAVMMPILMLVVWWVVSGSLQPVARVRSQVASRQADDLSPVSEAGLPDEVRPLVQELNLLFGRVRTAFEAQQHFVADAAHELRTPLAALRLQAQSLDRADTPEARQVAVGRLTAGIDRATRLVEQLLVLARQEATAAEGAAPRPGRWTWPTWRAARPPTWPAWPHAKGVDLGLQQADPASVDGQPDALQILLRNLVDNAIKYTPGGGTVDIVGASAAPARWRCSGRQRPRHPAGRTRTRVRPLLPRGRQRGGRQRPGPGHHQGDRRAPWRGADAGFVRAAGWADGDRHVQDAGTDKRLAAQLVITLAQAESVLRQRLP